ncbi:MAG: hypothetical protein M1812_000263 [Candelaria pacifica]|nr:MAG: hypothetical protein M1812_000263 [Candelaria pacifica]
MKLSHILLSTILVALTTASAVPGITERDNVLVVREALKACSGDRKDSDVCEGKKLRKQNSFHNCSSNDGKCCAKEKDGSGGQPATGNGEDCGYCFSGKCKG